MVMKNNHGSIGLGPLMFLLFLGLKLTGHIDWSWWWVTAPLWITFLLIFIHSVVTEFTKGR
jgi:hypothetical protein